VTSYTNPTSGPTVDVFLAKYSPSGSPAWSRSIGGNASDSAKAVAVDSSGNVAVTGSQASSSADYGAGLLPSRGGSDIFVAKYSSSGGYLWAKTLGSTGSDSGAGVATDGGGNVFVTGYFDLSVDFGVGSLTSAGSKDAFLVKYSSAGAHVFSRRIGSTGFDQGSAVATDGSGNVVVTGYFSGTINCGGANLTSAGLGDLFVAKYSATGQHLWSKRFGGTGDDIVYGIAVDTAGDVVLTGQFTNTVNFGDTALTALTSAGYGDVFLAKLLGGSGGHSWSKRFGSTTRTDVAYGVAVDGGRNVAITGFFGYGADFGGGMLVAQDYDIFVAKYDPAGTHISSKRYGDPPGQYAGQFGTAIAMSSGGNMFITGYFQGTLDFGAAGSMTSTLFGGSDAYLTSLGTSLGP
jgi:hypothetical protein